MPRMVFIHGVADVDRWLEGKAERAAFFESIGADAKDYVALDGSKQIAITAEVDDVEATQAVLASPPAEVAALMQKHGVLPPVTIYIEK